MKIKDFDFRIWSAKHKSYAKYENKSNTVTLLAFSSEDFPKSLLKDCEIELYTGYKDCKGNKIYEGDIVEFKTEGVVMQYYAKGAIKQDCKGEWIGYSVLSEIYSLIDICFRAKVVGNIHENAELLEIK